MKRILSITLAWVVFLLHPTASLAATQSVNTPATEGVSKNQAASTETQTDEEAVSIHRTFSYVEPEQISIKTEVAIVPKQEMGDEIKRKVLAEFTPIRLTVHNQSGKLLKIPNDSIFFIDGKGKKSRVPTEAEIFQEIKRNGVGRALLWGVPLGAVSFGILLLPAMAYSGVHTKVMNNGVKDNLSTNAFHGGTISPDGSFTTYLFIPKRQASKIKKVLLSRVMSIEDEVETQYIAEINELETANK